MRKKVIAGNWKMKDEKGGIKLISLIAIVLILIIILFVLVVVKRNESKNQNINVENNIASSDTESSDKIESNVTEKENIESEEKNTINDDSKDKYNTEMDYLDENKIENIIKKKILEIDAKTSTLENNKQKYAEAHTIFGKDIDGNTAYYTVIATYGVYEKEVNKINKISETNAPMLIGIDSNYKLISFEMPKDGEEYSTDIRKIFPDDIEEDIINNELEITDEENQIKQYFN